MMIARTPRGRATFALVLSFLVTASAPHAGAPDPEAEFVDPAAEIGSSNTPVGAPNTVEASDAVNNLAPLAGTPSAPVMINVLPLPPERAIAPRPVLDPSARLLRDDDASEAWTLFLELDSGHRITQRFLLTNVGPGEHSAVAVGHLVEPGRAPYRYENGRRRKRWTLSEDRLFFDIAASHLDLHRPKGELRITKDDIEIRQFFDFAPSTLSARIPSDRLPTNYHVEVLAIGTPTRGTIRAPWMNAPIETQGRAWLVHTWTDHDEAALIDRRVEFFSADQESAFYGIHLTGPGDWESAWRIQALPDGSIIESPINQRAQWTETQREAETGRNRAYPTPQGFEFADAKGVVDISLAGDWLRFDPLEVIPQPFRWIIAQRSQPQEVWADAQIGVSISPTPESPSLPSSGETKSVSQSTEASNDSRAHRESEEETADSSMTGVASITFQNPTGRR